jgi:hypothetical protein
MNPSAELKELPSCLTAPPRPDRGPAPDQIGGQPPTRSEASPRPDRGPARRTAFFHKEGGEWKIVHAHSSIGVANEEMLGKELTVR